jgi:hypothetical protein
MKIVWAHAKVSEAQDLVGTTTGELLSMFSTAHIIVGLIGVVAGAVGAWLGSRVQLEEIKRRIVELETLAESLPAKFVEMAECKQCKQLGQLATDRIQANAEIIERHLKESLGTVIRNQEKTDHKIEVLNSRTIRVLAQLFPKYVPGDEDV